MNILLIAPPVFDFYNTPHRMEPLGLLYIQKALRNEGHRAEIYDATASGKVKKQQTPPELAYLSEFYEEDRSPFSLHNGYKRFGDSFNAICGHVSQNNYDIIGISSLFSAYHPDVENLTAEIKKVFKGPVVIGGTAVNAQKETMMKTTNADYLIHGSGTVPMVQFVKAVSGMIPFDKVDGLIYRDGEKITINEASKEPAWSGGLIPDREHLRIFRKKRLAKTVFSSGCRNRCAFCSIHRDNAFMHRNISHIRLELEHLLRTGAQIVDIEDDDIFSDPDFARELLDLLEHFHKSGLEFTALNGLTAKNIVPFAGRLNDAGFIKLDLSLVSGSKTVSDELGRPHGTYEIEQIQKTVKGKMDIEVFIIPGLPGTTFPKTLETMVYLYKKGIKCGLSPLYLVPGVPMFEKAGIPEDLRLCRGSALYPFSPEERATVASLLKISRFLNYCLTDKNALSSENRIYFNRSLSRNQWFKRSGEDKWLDSFRFHEKFQNPFKLD